MSSAAAGSKLGRCTSWRRRYRRGRRSSVIVTCSLPSAPGREHPGGVGVDGAVHRPGLADDRGGRRSPFYGGAKSAKTRRGGGRSCEPPERGRDGRGIVVSVEGDDVTDPAVLPQGGGVE